MSVDSSAAVQRTAAGVPILLSTLQIASWLALAQETLFWRLPRTIVGTVSPRDVSLSVRRIDCRSSTIHRPDRDSGGITVAHAPTVRIAE